MNRQFQSYDCAASNFARGSEHLLKREGTIVYTKEDSRVPSLNTEDFVYWMKNRG